MFPTARYDSEANRFAPHEDYLLFEGFDFTGAVFKLQVRDRKNGGTLRADVVPTVETTTDGDGLITSTVSWTIPEATMEAMPLDSGDPDADVVLYLDLHITPSGESKFVAAGGTFTVKAGATE